MIVDFHTHVFAPELKKERGALLREGGAFAAIYGNPKAKMATAEELLGSMDGAGIDASVMLGFSWSRLETCRRHNDYLLDSARRSGRRLIPFVAVQPAADGEDVRAELRRCAEAGARGIGELRPEDQGWTATGPEADLLAECAREHGLVLVFHVSEPVGHLYPGKGGMELASFVAFASRHPDVRCVAAHWGGGLPFYRLMPEVASALANTWFDTAASSLLYSDEVFRVGTGLGGDTRVLFGSDFPLLSQRKCRERIEAAGLSDESRGRLLGENAVRLLGLE